MTEMNIKTEDTDLIEPFSAMDVWKEYPRWQLRYIGGDQVLFIRGCKQLGSSASHLTSLSPSITYNLNTRHQWQYHPCAGRGYTPVSERVHQGCSGQTENNGRNGLEKGRFFHHIVCHWRNLGTFVIYSGDGGWGFGWGNGHGFLRLLVRHRNRRDGDTKK